MRACEDCQLPLTARADDGTGRHKNGCPPVPDHEAYLAQRRERFPGLAEHHAQLKAGKTVEEILRDDRTVE